MQDALHGRGGTVVGTWAKQAVVNGMPIRTRLVRGGVESAAVRFAETGPIAARIMRAQRTALVLHWSVVAQGADAARSGPAPSAVTEKVAVSFPHAP
jgi:hypothetical protein